MIAKLRCLRPFFKFRRPLSTTDSSAHGNPSPPPPPPPTAGEEAGSREDAYRKLQNLDFMTAAQMVFNSPPKKKQFGLDFHLVQLFFVCMPSLAVYLVAQYARYEIRRMEAEAEVKKKKAEEEEKAKAAELAATEEESSNAELSKVIVRLDALEETVKEIVDEKKQTPPGSSPRKEQEPVRSSEPQSKSEVSEPAQDAKNARVGGSVPPSNAPSDDCKKELN